MRGMWSKPDLVVLAAVASLAILVARGVLSSRAFAGVPERRMRLEFLDPVSLLKIDQPISQTTKRLRIATKPFLSQVLTDQIQHGGEGTEVVVFLDIELYARFGHTPKYDSGQLKNC